MLSKNSRDNGPQRWKKTGCLNELAKHRNQICKRRHAEKFASLKLVQLAPRSFCHAEDGILHFWRFRDTRLQCFRWSRTSPAAWLGSPLLSLKTSTNWWKATSENCTRPLQSMSFTTFLLSLVSMLIEVWPRAAVAALGTWTHKIEIQRFQLLRVDKWTSHDCNGVPGSLSTRKRPRRMTI